MKHVFLLTMVLAAGGVLGAQPARAPESLTGWLYFKELRTAGPARGYTDFVLDREVLDQARPDQEDLRLYDSAGHEVPYALRVRRDVVSSDAFPAREFNRGVEGSAAQIYLDLGEQPQQHNEVEIDSAGNNFRRHVEVQGSGDGSQWSTLVSGAILFRFAAAGRTVEQRAVEYPVSRYRYLRIRVSRDPEIDQAAPPLGGVQVRRTVHLQGEMLSTVARMEARDADRVNARPASLWRVDLGGQIPIERVLVSISDAAFSRPFQLDDIDDPTAPVMLASGELTRRESSANPIRIDFQEHVAQHLKLTVIDDRNAALTVSEVTAEGAARRVIFDGASAAQGALRLYYGNPRALAPRYDFGVRLAPEPGPPASRVRLGSPQDNPIYRPEPKALSERAPWLIYLVLGAAGIVLSAILWSLAKAGRTVAGEQEV